MGERDTLLGAVLELLIDDTVRLMLADWLEEQMKRQLGRSVSGRGGT